MGKPKATKQTVNGIQFDSKKEAKRYVELLEMQNNGEIHGLERQVPFTVIPAQYANVDGKRRCVERPCIYVSDFCYITQDGRKVVEDVKGWRNTKGGAYAKFVIKRKLMLKVFGIKVQEV